MPHVLTNAPFDYDLATGRLAATGTWFDLPAIVITFIITAILVKGIKESASFNTGIVIVKVIIVLFVILVGAFYVNPENWHPFAPFGYTGLSFFGKTLFGQTGPGGEPLARAIGERRLVVERVGQVDGPSGPAAQVVQAEVHGQTV